MAADLFLTLGDIKGEASDAGQKGAMEVIAWSWGMTQPGKWSSGTSKASGKVAVHDLEITKFIDKATPNLIIAACCGTPYAEGKLIGRVTGKEKPIDQLVITMKDVVVSEISSTDKKGSERPIETVKLNFSWFNVAYTPVNGEGMAEAAVEQPWSIKENAKG